MNNEETVIAQPKNESDTKRKANVETKKNDKPETEKKIAATATAAAIGGAAGSGVAYAATTMLHSPKPNEPAKEQVTEKPITVTDAPKEEIHSGPEQISNSDETATSTNEESGTEADYTGHNDADPVMTSPQVHTAINEEESQDTVEVRVLGIYEAQGDSGQTMQAAVLTNGDEVAAVVDLDGDGIADVIAADNNHNQQIDEDEVYDISENQIPMAGYQQAYVAQKEEEQMQQEQETFTNNTDDDQQDFDNNADYSQTV